MVLLEKDYVQAASSSVYISNVTFKILVFVNGVVYL